MSFRSFPRQQQLLLTVTLLGTMAGCTGIKDDGTRTRTEGAVGGAAIGAAAGAGTGALLKKGQPEAAVAGATAGAAVGAVAGSAYGDSVAKKKEDYVQKESALDAQLSGLNNQIAKLKARNATLASEVDQQEQKLAAVLAGDRSKGPTVQEFELRTSVNSRIGQADRDARSWQETIEAHKAVLAKASSDPRSGDLQSEIEQLSAQRDELLRQRTRLVSINNKLK